MCSNDGRITLGKKGCYLIIIVFGDIEWAGMERGGIVYNLLQPNWGPPSLYYLPSFSKFVSCHSSGRVQS